MCSVVLFHLILTLCAASSWSWVPDYAIPLIGGSQTVEMQANCSGASPSDALLFCFDFVEDNWGCSWIVNQISFDSPLVISKTETSIDVNVAAVCSEPIRVDCVINQNNDVISIEIKKSLTSEEPSQSPTASQGYLYVQWSSDSSDNCDTLDSDGIPTLTPTHVATVSPPHVTTSVSSPGVGVSSVPQPDVVVSTPTDVAVSTVSPTDVVVPSVSPTDTGTTISTGLVVAIVVVSIILFIIIAITFIGGMMIVMRKHAGAGGDGGDGNSHKKPSISEEQTCYETVVISHLKKERTTVYEGPRLEKGSTVQGNGVPFLCSTDSTVSSSHKIDLDLKKSLMSEREAASTVTSQLEFMVGTNADTPNDDESTSGEQRCTEMTTEDGHDRWEVMSHEVVVDHQHRIEVIDGQQEYEVEQQRESSTRVKKRCVIRPHCPKSNDLRTTSVHVKKDPQKPDQNPNPYDYRYTVPVLGSKWKAFTDPEVVQKELVVMSVTPSNNPVVVYDMNTSPPNL